MEDEGLESTTTNCIGSGSSNSSSSGGSLLSMHDDSSAGIRSDLGAGRPQFVFTSPSSKTPEPTSAAPTTSSSPPKKSGGSGGSRRSVQKRVVSVPITDADGSRSKGSGEGSPPSDSWTWRKYGQKPIKGSPYPRGYYRCSSSKGCPARKQVERSRTDPNLLVVTYASEHNHPWPLPKNHNNSNNNNHHNSLHPSSHASVVTTADPSQKPTTFPEEETEEVVLLPPAPSATTTTTTTTTTANTTSTSSPEETSFSADLAEESSLMLTDHLGWFSGTSDTFLDGGSVAAMLLPVTYDDFGKDLGVGGCGGGPGGGGDDDDALFAELDELPECSMVFRRSAYDGSRGCSLTTSSWCGSTG